MKKKMMLIFGLCATMMLHAAVYKTVNVSAGGLSTVLTSAEKTTITNLTVTGTIDARDFRFLRDSITSLSDINLSASTIQSYNGTAGTISTINLYPANEIPMYSFEKAILKSIVLPSSITSIGEFSINNCTGLTSITIPGSVTSIGDYAFYGCSGLTGIAIPSTVITLGESAFSNCIGLTSLTLPASIQAVEIGTFSNCSGLTSVTIPNTIDSIGDWAFSNCVKLSNVTIPGSVLFIGDGAFYGCSGITSISIPSSVNSVGEGAFASCTGISGMVLPNSVSSIQMSTFSDCTGLTSITIPNSVTSIADWSFYNCSKLLSVTMASVTSIGSYAFSNCIGLRSATIPTATTAIKDHAFMGCTGLTSITIPNSVTLIGDYAFSTCSLLTSITIPYSITSIGNGIFFLCSKLATVMLPNSITTIGSQAFNGCSKLVNFTIPSAVTKIGIYAFYRCTSMNSINIPSTVTSIGSNAFSSCTHLDSISVYPNTPINLSTSTTVFNSVNKTTCILFVPFGKKSTYLTANQWKDFTNIVEMSSVSSYTQKIPLAYGWNIISSNVIPSNIDLKNIVQPLIDGGKLNKVMDESGQAIENFAALGGWNNSIGNFSPSEGYKVYMSSADTLSLEGQAITLPFDIALSAGWNIVSYPCSNIQDAWTIIQPLIDGGKLKKVMDESGKSIEDFGVFGGWKNDIGNFYPGKGYKIYMSSSDTLTVTSTILRALATTRKGTMESTYFTKVWDGNGTDHMNINLVELGSSFLNVNDEIGIFDGENCVGSATIGSDQMAESSISIPTSCNDGQSQTVNGFIPGHPISLRVYSGGDLYKVTMEKLLGTTLFEKDGSLFAKVVSKELVDTPTDLSKNEESVQMNCYPNPFVDEITIDVKNTQSKKMTVEIYSLLGQKIKFLYQGETDSIHLKWNGTDEKGNKVNPGVYLCKVNDSTRKVVYTGQK